MPERKFSISFRPTREAAETTPLSVLLSPIPTNTQGQARYNHLAVVPYHPSSEVTTATAADCYLQLWELDRFKVDRYLTTEESDLGPLDNRLVATFPGVIEVVGSRYKFRPTDPPFYTRGSVEPLNGFVTVKLQNTSDTEEISYTVPLPEYEGVLELAGVIRPNSADRNYATETEISPHQVRNVQAALRRQIDEWGGFAVAFVTDYSTAAPITDLTNNWSNNNAEFPRQAEDMIDATPTFIFEGSAVKMGFHFTRDYRQWAGIIDTLRNEVASLLGIPLANRPPVSVLEIYCHGIRKACHIDAAGYNGAGSLRTTTVDDFITRLSTHMSDHIVIPLFACNTGRSVYSGGNGQSDPTFARRRIGDELGADGLAWVLQRKLQRAGHDHATVWGHTLAAHTTRNPYLAVFSPYGSADAAPLFRRADRLSAAGFTAYFQQFAHSQANISDTLYRQRLHNANLLRILCLQNALYFPWAWNRGLDPTPATPGFNPRANTRARAVFDELSGLFAGLGVEPDEFTFTTDRKFITGAAPGVANPQVSEHFPLTAYSAHFPPNLLSIRLARMVQLLRHRSNKAMGIDALTESGQGAFVTATPHSTANINAIETSANNMRDDGLFTYVRRDGNRIEVSVSGVVYDAAGTYITGRHADVPNPQLAPNLPYSAFEPLARPMRLHRNLPHVMSRCMEAAQMTLTPQSIEDTGDTLVFNGATRTAEALAEAEIHAAFGTIARASRGPLANTVVLSMR